MEVSIFLAKLFGLYFLLVGVFSFFHRKAFMNILNEFFISKGLLVLSGFISLSIGLAIVVGHPIYTFDWRGVITCIGYLAIIKGIIHIWYPILLDPYVMKCIYKYFSVILTITLILGVFLTYVGFIA